MNRKNKVLEALVIGSLLATPGMASAAYQGTVTVDGKTVAEPVAHLTEIGSEGSTVEIGSDLSSSIPVSIFSNRDADGETLKVSGASITTGSVYLQNNDTVSIGTASTDTVTIKGGEDHAGISAYNLTGDKTKGPQVTVTGKTINISTDNTEADGWGIIELQNGTQEEMAPSGATHVTITGDTINLTSPELGIVNYSNGQLDINGDTTITAPIALSVRGNSTTNINTDGKHSTVINGDIQFETPATSSNSHNSGNLINANVNLNLSGEDSVWNGSAYGVYTGEDATEESKHLIGSGFTGEVSGMNLTMADGATWNVTSDTLVSDLEADSSTINVLPETTTMKSGTLNLTDSTLNLEGSGQTITADTLSGSNATVNTNSLDNQLSVSGTSTATNLTVHGTGEIADAIAKDNSNAQKLADVVVLSNANDDTTESLASQITTDEGVVAGAYNLKVVNGTVNMAQSTYTPNVTNVGIASMAAMNLMTWRQENNDLNKRLGELRDSSGENGVWARMSRGEAKYGARNMKNQYNYYQLGYDRKVGDNWTVGAAYSKTDGNTTFSRGKSDNDHNGFAIYGSHLSNDGSFIDLIAKYARIDTDYSVSGGVGNGDYDTDGYSLSAEYGKRFHGQQGFWIEPQVELTYGRVSSADYTSARGAQIRHDSMDSTVARLGFAAGKDIKAGHVYARASYLYDFGGDTNVTMRYNGTSESYKDDIGGSWWEVGLGANLNLSDVTHFYMDVEKTYGGDVTTPWQWNAGFRYSF